MAFARSHLRVRPAATAHASTPSAERTAAWYAQYYNFCPQQTWTGVAPPVIAIISLGGSFMPEDINTYWQTTCGIPAAAFAKVTTVPLATPVPVFSGSSADMENTLDIEIIGAACPGCTILFYQATNTLLGFYNAYSAAITGTTIGGTLYKAQIVSCSWGAPEASFPLTSTTGPSIFSFNALLGLGVSQGVTFTVATGDSGSGDGVAAPATAVDFPASSPYVVACGGTSASSGNPATDPAWSWNSQYGWGGGGGVSSVFGQPTYQNGSTVGVVAPIGAERAIPDISFNADPLNGYTIVFNGQTYTNAIGGTSCCAPLMAAYLGLVNRNYPLGFNTTLYSVYQAGANNRTNCFWDTTVGNNDSIEVGGSLYACKQWYDCVTGCGSINGTNLLHTLVNYSTLQPAGT